MIDDWFKPEKGVLNIVVAGDPKFSNAKYFLKKMNSIVAGEKKTIEITMALYLEKTPFGRIVINWVRTRKIKCNLFGERNYSNRNDRMLERAKLVVLFGSKVSPVSKNLIKQAKEQKKKVRRIFGG